jgi:thiol-disulfide isomerase/thioredoxin
MKRLVLILILACFSIQYSVAQDTDIPVMSYEEFSPYLHQNNDTLYVINFWATWCKPCVVELPYFEKINELYADKKVKVILVSLDFPDEMDTRLKPFVTKKGLKSDIILLNETDPNTFIDKVSPKWSGAIPATYIYKGSNSDFYEMSFSFEELETIIKQKIN